MTMSSRFPTRKHLSFAEARRAYNRGENLTQHLRQQLNVKNNTPAIIEMAYDIQAGTYVKITNDTREFATAYAQEVAAILNPYLEDGDVLLDVGCGELTTISLIANGMKKEVSALYAFDISWSRVKIGLGFAAKNMKASVFRSLQTFTADISEIPLVSKSVDVSISSHAIEPNGGREKELLEEIFRVTRRAAILFEPSYELNTDEGRLRMDRLGYAKNLRETISDLGGTLTDVIPLSNLGNPLNPTAAYIIQLDSLPHPSRYPSALFSDPGADTLLQQYETYFFSNESGLSYPIIAGIPVLRSNAAVLTSAMDSAPTV